MHVDGGVGARVFLNGGVFHGSVIRERGGQGGLGKEDIFVIHNGQLVPHARPGAALAGRRSRCASSTPRAAPPRWATCSASTAMRSARRPASSWITIPDDVKMGGDEVFDPAQMQVLYDLRLAPWPASRRRMAPPRRPGGSGCEP